MVFLQKRATEFKDYRDYIGMDISSLVSLPLFIMEPYTMLQKVAEIMEYTELLDQAANTEDPYERYVLLAHLQCRGCSVFRSLKCRGRWR